MGSAACVNRRLSKTGSRSAHPGLVPQGYIRHRPWGRAALTLDCDRLAYPPRMIMLLLDRVHVSVIGARRVCPPIDQPERSVEARPRGVSQRPLDSRGQTWCQLSSCYCFIAGECGLPGTAGQYKLEQGRGVAAL